MPSLLPDYSNNSPKDTMRRSSLPTPQKIPAKAGQGSTIKASPAKKAPFSKAVYLAVKDSTSEDLESMEEFDMALQHAGKTYSSFKNSCKCILEIQGITQHRNGSRGIGPRTRRP